jgi:hypothetical protein
MGDEYAEDDIEEEVEVAEAPRKRGRPTGAKNKPKAPPNPDVYSALQDRIAHLEASANKVVMKPQPRKKPQPHLVGSPTHAARQLCEILRRDGILPPAPVTPPPRETRRTTREALYASFLS